ncbi:MAG TPA: hypothetical protein VJ738_06515 [Steroidobacteraceae bacterium]|nr:hypothetical protein [Steroidobacteraceae bacterium]
MAIRFGLRAVVARPEYDLRSKRKFTERALWFYVLVKTPNGCKIAADT